MLLVRFIFCFVVPVLFGTLIASAAEPDSFSPRLFVFQNGVDFGSYQEEAAILKELGYDGIGSVKPDRLGERIAACEAVGLNVFSVYISLGDPRIAKVISQLKNHQATIELTVRKTIDKDVIKEIQGIADSAARANLQIAIYPHAGFTIATIDPALELVKKVNRQNVGVMFNLCHFLKSENESDLEATLTRMGEKLFAVSTCGADSDGSEWKDLIQPLDKGTFQQTRLLGTLKKLNFQGVIGIQCYAVQGDKQANLQRSIKAWKQIMININKQ